MYFKNYIDEIQYLKIKSKNMLPVGKILLYLKKYLKIKLFISAPTAFEVLSNGQSRGLARFFYYKLYFTLMYFILYKYE